jgi:hypothetical protein
MPLTIEPGTLAGRWRAVVDRHGDEAFESNLVQHRLAPAVILLVGGWLVV